MSLFLILGLSNGGLFLIRQIRYRFSDATIYAIGTSDDIGQFSSFINVFYPVSSEDETVDRINEVISVANGLKLRAFMCSNPMLECIVLHHPEFFERLEFENPYDLYRQIVNKEEVDKLCRSLKISRPEEYGFSDFTEDSIRFPVVVKPLEKTKTKGASKCAYINTRDELEAYMTKISRLNIDFKNLVCQQLVKGDNRWEYGYGGYFRNGVPVVDICFHQFRQMPQGLCCYIREMTDVGLISRIKALVEPFLEHTHYSGFIEFDIKEDEDSHVLFLLDINPRPWHSVDILSAKLGETSVFAPCFSESLAVWRYPYREVFSFQNKKNVPYPECRALTGRKRMKTVYALSDRKDKGPSKEQRRRDWKDLIRILKKKI